MMSGNEVENRKVVRHWRKVDSNWADVMLSRRLLQITWIMIMITRMFHLWARKHINSPYLTLAVFCTLDYDLRKLGFVTIA